MKRLLYIILMALATLSAGAVYRQDSVRLTYKLHGQTRRVAATFRRDDKGSVRMDWAIERNLKMWRGSYTMSPRAVETAPTMSFLMPEDGKQVQLPDNETFAILSKAAFTALRDLGEMQWNNTTYRLDSIQNGRLHATDIEEGAVISVLDDPEFPLITSMAGNPLEINWTAEIF